GFIGVSACKELMRRGVETIAAGRTPRPYGTFTSYVTLDRSDRAQLVDVLKAVRPEVVLDLAAYQPAEVRTLLESFDGERYVFVSTGGVYPDLSGRRAREEDFVPLEGPVPTDPQEYRDGKRWCETVLARTPERRWVAIRPSAVFGPEDPTLRIAAYLQRLEDGGPLLAPGETYEWQMGLAWVRDVGYGCALACDLRRGAAGAVKGALEGGDLPGLLAADGPAVGPAPGLGSGP